MQETCARLKKNLQDRRESGENRIIGRAAKDLGAIIDGFD
jgi:hypothetical protein